MIRTILHSRITYVALSILLLSVVAIQLAFQVNPAQHARAASLGVTIKGNSPADGGELILGANRQSNLFAGAGNDYLVGRSQSGSDVMIAGAGNDTFNLCSSGPDTGFIVAPAKHTTDNSHYTIYMRLKKDYVINFAPHKDHVIGCDHMSANLANQAAFPFLVEAPFPGHPDIAATLNNLPQQDGVLQVNGNATSLAQKLDTGTTIPVQGTLLAGLPVNNPLRNFVWTCLACASVITGAPNYPTQLQPGIPELPDYPAPLNATVESDVGKGTEKLLGGTSTDVFSLFLFPNQVDLLNQLQNPNPGTVPLEKI